MAVSHFYPLNSRNSRFAFPVLITVVAGAVLLLSAITGPSAAFAQTDPRITQWTDLERETNPVRSDVFFTVLRGDSELGTHTLQFDEIGDELHVRIAIDLEVRIGPFRVFNYRHRNYEVWKDGQLIKITTRTNDNGDDYAVDGEATEDGFKVVSTTGSFTAPASILPTSYWNPATQSATQLLDTQRGRLIEVTTKPTSQSTMAVQGQPVSLQKYEMTGDLRLSIWYSPKGELLDIGFVARGEECRYVINEINRPTLQKVAAK